MEAVTPISGRLSTVKRAMKSPPTTPSPERKTRGLRRRRIALTIQCVADRINQTVKHGQREAIVRQRLGEFEHDVGCCQFAVYPRMIDDGHPRDGDDPVVIADQAIVSRRPGNLLVQRLIHEAGRRATGSSTSIVMLYTGGVGPAVGFGLNSS